MHRKRPHHSQTPPQVLSQPVVLALSVVIVVSVWLFLQFGTGSSVGQAFEQQGTSFSSLDYASQTLVTSGKSRNGPSAEFFTVVLDSKKSFSLPTTAYDAADRLEIEKTLNDLSATGALSYTASPSDFSILVSEEFDGSIIRSGPDGLWLFKSSNTYIVEFDLPPLASVMMPNPPEVVQEEVMVESVRESADSGEIAAIVADPSQQPTQEPNLMQDIPPEPVVVSPETESGSLPSSPEVPLEPVVEQDIGVEQEVTPLPTDSEVPADESSLLTGYAVEGFESPRAYQERVQSEQRRRVDEINARLRSTQGGSVRAIEDFTVAINAVVIEMDEVQVEIARAAPGVKAVHPNFKVTALLSNAGQYVQAPRVWGSDRIGNGCVESGEPCITGRGVSVAIIDTGIDYTHPDLGSCSTAEFLAGDCDKVRGGYDFTDQDTNPMDENGHGTHVAGIVAGNPTPGEAPGQADRYYGIAPDATLYAYKVLNAAGSGSYAGVIAGIEAAIVQDVDIMSLSLGGPGSSDDPVSVALDNAMDAGILAVVAAGNSGPYEKTIGAPGVSRKALTVGAIDSDGELAYFSSRGPVLINTEYIGKPDIVAPGVDVCSARLGGAYAERVGCTTDSYVPLSGTSMATPVVSGVAALMKQAFPDSDGPRLKTLLTSTATDLGYVPSEQGSGAVNASAALLNPLLIEGSLDFDLASESEKTLILTNTGNETVTVTLAVRPAIESETDEAFEVLAITPSTVVLEPRASAPVTATVIISSNLEGIFEGFLDLSYDGVNVSKPYGLVRLSTLEVIVPAGKHPVVTLVDQNMLFIDSFDVSGENTAARFAVKSGSYYVIANGWFFNPEQVGIPGEESSEYVWASAVDVGLGTPTTITFSDDDLYEHLIVTQARDGESTKLLMWERSVVLSRGTYGFCSFSELCEEDQEHSCFQDDYGNCRDKAFQSTMIATLEPTPTLERKLFVSKSPEGTSLDVVLMYTGSS